MAKMCVQPPGVSARFRIVTDRPSLLGSVPVLPTETGAQDRVDRFVDRGVTALRTQRCVVLGHDQTDHEARR